MPDTHTHTSVSDPLMNAGPVPVHATGTFEVKLVPQGAADKGEGSTLGRLSLDKQFHRDLEATSKVQMLTGLTDVKGAAVKHAVEAVAGALRCRSTGILFLHQ